MMFEYINKDIERFFKGNKKSSIKIIRLISSNPGMHGLIVYRFGRWILKDRSFFNLMLILNPLYILLNLLIRKLYGINISQDANIASGFYIGHFSGIEIGPCIIGHRVTIGHQSKICVNKNQENVTNKILVIGDNVWIGAHSRIDCGLDISNGVTVAAGSRVINDIEASSLVAGDPARTIKKNYDNSKIL